MSGPVRPPLTTKLDNDSSENRPVNTIAFANTDFSLTNSGTKTTVALSGGGGGTIGGSIADTQVAFGTAADTIGGTANFLFTQGSNQQLEINQTSTAGLGTIALKEAGTTAGIFQYRGSTNGTNPNTIRIGTNVAGGNLLFMTDSATARMYIDSAGKVGIGTTSPSTPLHVKDTTTGSFLLLENVDTGGASAPDLVLYRNSTSPVSGDFIGVVDFKGKDVGGSEVYYGRIAGQIRDSSTGTHDGSIIFVPARNASVDVNNNLLKLSGEEGAVFNENGLDNFDFRVESDTETHALFVDAGLNAVGINGIAQSDSDLTVYHTNSGTTQAALRLVSTDGGQNVAPVLDLYRDAGAAPNDIIGAINFSGNNSTPAKLNYMRILSTIIDETAGTEDATLKFVGQRNNAEVEWLRLQGSGFVINNVANSNLDLSYYAQGFSTSDDFVHFDNSNAIVNIGAGIGSTGLADNNPFLQVQGSISSKCAIVTKTSATVDLSTRVSNELIGQLYVLTSGSAKTFTVPTSCTQGDWFRVLTTGANGMDIVSTGGATLNGATPASLNRDAQNEIYTVVAIADNKWVCTSN